MSDEERLELARKARELFESLSKLRAAVNETITIGLQKINGERANPDEISFAE